jgi:hypothetical protein
MEITGNGERMYKQLPSNTFPHGEYTEKEQRNLLFGGGGLS